MIIKSSKYHLKLQGIISHQTGLIKSIQTDFISIHRFSKSITSQTHQLSLIYCPIEIDWFNSETKTNKKSIENKLCEQKRENIKLI